MFKFAVDTFADKAKDLYMYGLQGKPAHDLAAKAAGMIFEKMFSYERDSADEPVFRRKEIEFLVHIYAKRWTTKVGTIKCEA